MKEDIQKIKEKKSLEGLSVGLFTGAFLYALLSAFIDSLEIKLLIVGIVSFVIFLYERSISEFE